MSEPAERGSLAPPPPPAPLHPRSFKLRFAAQCELGRSRVSAIKPLALPATVTDKFYRAESREADGADDERLLRRVREMFDRGPRERLPAPLTSSHVYGWWAAPPRPQCAGARLEHGIRDSAWLKERVRVLAADAGYKR